MRRLPWSTASDRAVRLPAGEERIAVIDREFADAHVDEEQLTSDYGLKDRESKARQVRKDEATLAKAKIKDEAKIAQLHQRALDMDEDLAKRRKYKADTTTALGASTFRIVSATKRPSGAMAGSPVERRSRWTRVPSVSCCRRSWRAISTASAVRLTVKRP